MKVSESTLQQEETAQVTKEHPAGSTLSRRNQAHTWSRAPSLRPITAFSSLLHLSFPIHRVDRALRVKSGLSEITGQAPWLPRKGLSARAWQVLPCPLTRQTLFLCTAESMCVRVSFSYSKVWCTGEGSNWLSRPHSQLWTGS